MSTISIIIDVPEGATFHVVTSQPEQAGIPQPVRDAIDRLVPSRYLAYVEQYLNRAIADLGCTVEFPRSTKRKNDYLNVFPPERCARKRVSGITYASSRTAIFTGPVDLNGFEHAMKTLNSGKYAYPKLPHLDSVEAVDEALELTATAIERLEP